MNRVGAFPGSFNPPTVAHLAIAEAARDAHRLDRLELVVSRRPLGKADVVRPTIEERLEVLGAIAERVGWLGVTVTDDQLLADIAAGYDVVVMGADKWHQIHELEFYDGSPERRDAAIDRLGLVAVVPRGGLEVPPEVRLHIDPAYDSVSSTLARQGHHDLMAPEALRHIEARGSWD